uniref:Ig-like domain-containing protein n=1 Tax=Esox lucius TaxID=8010 RepID=A0A3P8YQ72_ESOLU
MIIFLKVIHYFLVTVSGQNLYQDQISETKRQRKSVSFNCKITGRCWEGYVFWYQKRESEPFTWILWTDLDDNSVSSDTTHPQRADFSVSKESGSSQLKIQSVKESHSATYYCACYQSSGTHSENSSTQTVLKPCGFILCVNK